MSVLKMSHKERQRVEVWARVARGELTLTRAAEWIGLGYRQALRSYDRYQQLGDRGVVHRARGRASNHRSAPVNRKRVLALYAKKYGDFGPTLAAEYLVREEGLRVSVTTLRRWLIAAQLWKPKPLRSPHRQWRERKANFGELVQIDGSRHAWLEGRGPQLTLMVMIDDATNWTYARFFESESLESVLRVFQGYVESYGLPRSLYSDRHGIYVTTRDATVDEALANTAPPTQSARAMQTLGVQLILANSPQAKGRVERRHQVFQDRLVKALRLKKISTLESANAFLDSGFLADLNERFHETARSPADVHRTVPRLPWCVHHESRYAVGSAGVGGCVFSRDQKCGQAEGSLFSRARRWLRLFVPNSRQRMPGPFRRQRMTLLQADSARPRPICQPFSTSVG